jgi:hypothetical protein
VDVNESVLKTGEELLELRREDLLGADVGRGGSRGRGEVELHTTQGREISFRRARRF